MILTFQKKPMHLFMKVKNYGEIVYSVDGTVSSTVNLIAKNNVKKISFPNMLAHTLGKWFNLLRN